MNLCELPDDIIRLIQEYVPHRLWCQTNRANYIAYHTSLSNLIPMYENYVRDTIRRDMGYVFEQIVRENMDRWLKNRQYRYKNMKFNGYIHFIIYFCIENNAEHCRQWLMDYLESRQLCKNLYKKNVVRYIKWMNSI